MSNISDNIIRDITHTFSHDHQIFDNLVAAIYTNDVPDTVAAAQNGELIEKAITFLKLVKVWDKLPTLFASGGPTKYVEIYKLISENVTEGYVNRKVPHTSVYCGEANYLKHYLFITAVIALFKKELEKQGKLEILGVLDIGLIGNTEFLSRLIVSSGLKYDISKAMVAQYIRTENESDYLLSSSSFKERMRRQALCDFTHFLENTFSDIPATIEHMLITVTRAKKTDAALLRLSNLPERNISNKAGLLIDRTAIILGAYGIKNFGETWPKDLVYDAQRFPGCGRKPLSHILGFVDFYASTLISGNHGIPAFTALIDYAETNDLISRAAADTLRARNNARKPVEKVEKPKEDPSTLTEFTLDCGDTEVTITTKKKNQDSPVLGSATNTASPKIDIPFKTLPQSAWVGLFEKLIETRNANCIFANEYTSPILISVSLVGTVQKLNTKIEKLNLGASGVDRIEGMRRVRNAVLEYQIDNPLNHTVHKTHSILFILLGYILAGFGAEIPKVEIMHLAHLACDYQLIINSTVTKIEKMLKKSA